MTIFRSLLEGGVEADAVDDAKAVSAYGKANPYVLLGPVELASRNIHVETTLGSSLRVRYIVASHRLLAGNLTNFRHNLIVYDKQKINNLLLNSKLRLRYSALHFGQQCSSTIFGEAIVFRPANLSIYRLARDSPLPMEK